PEAGEVGLAERAHLAVGAPVERDAVPALLPVLVPAVDGEDAPLHAWEPLEQTVGEDGSVDAGDPVAAEGRAHGADAVVPPPLGEVTVAVEDTADVGDRHEPLLRLLA